MQMKIRLFSLLLLLSVFIKAQTPVSGEMSAVDDQISAFLGTWNIPGASVAITKNGEMIYNKGFGFADAELKKPAKADDLYRVASVSKPVTAIAIMKLVENGLLNLDDKVFGRGRILNQPYYLSAISDKRIYSITVKQLLEHTSGWDRNMPCDGYDHSDPAFYPLHVTTILDEPNPVGDSTLIKFSLLKGIHHEPGSKYVYSNVGYLVLGKIIEKLSGLSYETYVRQNILDPLQINDMHLAKNLKKDSHKKETSYYNSTTSRSVYGDGSIVPSQYGGFNIEAMNAHGGWIASAASLTKLILAVDGFSTVEDILKPETISEMTTSGERSVYAKGWNVKRGNWWHTGSLNGTSAFICRAANGYTWAFLLNSRSVNSNAFWMALDRLPWECVSSLEQMALNEKLKEEVPLHPIKGIAP
jgi:CubicO group peptidase (beta-lactamase class C family)